MKKFIAVMLCFACVFAFAACNKEEAPPAETTGKPGEWITDENGDVVMTETPFLVLDENDEPVLDENGKPQTTIVQQIATYPAAPGETFPTKAPTVAPGNTIKSEKAAWPAHSFMEKFPKLKDTVDKATYQKNDNGELVTVYVNEISYDEFLSYIETCKKAGFTQKNEGTKLPEKAEAGKSYAYLTEANGLYITMTYYTNEYPYRSCDLFINVSSYNLLDTIG